MEKLMVNTSIDICKDGEKSKIIDLNGWSIYEEFDGLEKEISAINSNVGMMDLSYMGKIIVKGEDAEGFLQYITTSNIKSLRDNKVMYTFICHPSGGIINDLLVYRISKKEYMLLLNYENLDSSYKWMDANLYMYNVELCNLSNDMRGIAIEGKKSEEFLQKFTPYHLNKLNINEFDENIMLNGLKFCVSRGSYIGREGFTILGNRDSIDQFYNFIISNKENFNIEQIGIKAQNILRFDSGLPVYGLNINEDLSPFGASYGSIVDMTKEDFIGKYAFIRENEENIGKKIVYFNLFNDAIPEKGMDVLVDGIICGRVISVVKSFKLNKYIGVAAIEKSYESDNLTIKNSDEYIKGKTIVR